MGQPLIRCVALSDGQHHQCERGHALRAILHCFATEGLADDWRNFHVLPRCLLLPAVQLHCRSLVRVITMRLPAPTLASLIECVDVASCDASAYLQSGPHVGCVCGKPDC